ncbi:hypothetical protein BIW11_01210 [Tropilaelaps mercedesae]|uniref:Uncharacterized protein n=1 Tax=Tropilaelaps mercedesae TaxID=418985 RepID=A0A1V9XHV9_9ACAR|nr:hypothetical protein BIW11_01210 [Tropilaelaps mercedesae]
MQSSQGNSTYSYSALYICLNCCCPQLSSLHHDGVKVSTHINGDIPLPKSLAQKPMVSVSKESLQCAKDDIQVAIDRVAVDKRRSSPEDDSKSESGHIKVTTKANDGSVRSESMASSVAALTGAPTVKQETPMKPLPLPVLVHQQMPTTNGGTATPAAGLKLPPAAKPALFIIKVPPSQAGQFNIVTVQPQLNPVNGRTNLSGLNGITGVVNGIGSAVNGLPVNGAVVVNNLNGLPLNNLTSLASLNTTLSNAINSGFNNNNTINNNNNNTLQLNNCKIVSVPSPVAVQKVSVQQMKKLEDESQCGRAFAVSSPGALSTQYDSSSRASAIDDMDLVRGADVLFEKVARTHEQQTWFLANLGLCTRDKYRALSERRKERRRRKTANPQFSSAAMEERRKLESLRRKKKLVIPDGMSKLAFKEELEQRAERLKMERQELLKKHEQAQQRLLEERTRSQALSDEHRSMEETLERLRSFVTMLAEQRPTVKWT